MNGCETITHCVCLKDTLRGHFHGIQHDFSSYLSGLQWSPTTCVFEEQGPFAAGWVGSWNKHFCLSTHSLFKVGMPTEQNFYFFKKLPGLPLITGRKGLFPNQIYSSVITDLLKEQ